MIGTRWRWLLLLPVTLMLAGGVRGDAGEPDAEAIATPDPIEMYDVREVRGWEVYVNQRLLDEPELAEDVLDLLDHRLAGVVRLLPKQAVGKLQTVKIWVELEHPTHPLIHYHPNRRWLMDNGFLAEKVRSVEIGSAQAFLRSHRQQPAVMIHELAHAWHHQFLPDGYANAEIRAAYEQAVASGDYEEVLHVSGRRTRHYALSNPMEYFAEGAEAYFSTNDFYPFVRAELKEHDPVLYALLERLWHEDGGEGGAAESGASVRQGRGD